MVFLQHLFDPGLSGRGRCQGRDCPGLRLERRNLTGILAADHERTHLAGWIRTQLNRR